MAATKYTYSIASDFPGTGLDSSRLTIDIQTSSIVTALDRIDTSGDTCDIWFKDALSAGDKTTLDGDTTGPAGGVIAAHTGVPLVPSPEVVHIEEEVIPTGGHYQVRGIAENVPDTVGWHDFTDFSWPYAISLLSAEAYSKTENDKDEIEFLVAPDTTIGALTADATTSGLELDVQQSVIDNIEIGYFVTLADGTNTDSCGRCLGIDNTGNKITIETAPSNAYAAVTPTYVKMTAKMVCDCELTGGQRLVLGESKIGGSHVPVNTTMRLRYNNKDGIAKRFAFTMEYLY